MEPEEQIHADSLSLEAHFAWVFHVAERAEIRLAQKSSRPIKPLDEVHFLTVLRDFYAAMQSAYGLTTRAEILAGRSKWLDDYLTGVRELADLKLVRLARNAEGSYDVVQMFPERLKGGEIILNTDG